MGRLKDSRDDRTQFLLTVLLPEDRLSPRLQKEKQMRINLEFFQVKIHLESLT
jgi:hypothetical protein